MARLLAAAKSTRFLRTTAISAEIVGSSRNLFSDRRVRLKLHYSAILFALAIGPSSERRFVEDAAWGRLTVYAPGNNVAEI